MGGHLHSESYYWRMSLYFTYFLTGFSVVTYFAVAVIYCFFLAKSSESTRSSSSRCSKWKSSIPNEVDKLLRNASKAFLGAPFSLFTENSSDLTNLYINSQEVSKATLLMLGGYVYFAIIAVFTISWDTFIVDYSATCDDKMDCFLHDKNGTQSIQVTDCSIVKEGSTVACYKLSYHTYAIAAAGGLIIIFKLIPFLVSSVLLRVYFCFVVCIEKFARRNIKRIPLFKKLDYMKEYYEIKIMAIFLVCFFLVIVGFLALVQLKCNLQPDIFLTVAWFSFAISYSALIPWPNYISPRENQVYVDVKKTEESEEVLKEAIEAVEEDGDEREEFEHIDKKEVYETVEDNF